MGVIALLALGGAAPAQSAEVVTGGRAFDVTSAPAGHDLYQAAYSARNDLVWVTGTTHQFNLGYPVAATSTLTALNPDTLQVVRTITPRMLDAGTANQRPEAAYGLAVDDENNRVWTTSTREGTVVVYDQATGNRVATISGVDHGRDIAIDPYRDYAYVSDPNDGRDIVRVSTNTLQVVNRIQPSEVASFSPMSLDLVADANRALLYTVNLDTGALVELDTLNFSTRVVAMTGGQRASGVAVDPARGLAYVASQDSSDLRTVNIATGQVVATATASAALLNVAVDPARGLVYAAEFGGSSVFVADANTGARIGEIPIGAAPNDVVVARDAAWAVDRSVSGAGGTSQLWKIVATGTTDRPDTAGGPTSGAAVATVACTPRVGGTITLQGTGWRTQAGTQGSVIAIKLDDGAIRKPTSDVWQVIEAKADGTFSAQIRLPDGTTNATTGSTPAYTQGAHWLRLLTGSLRSGDTVRTQRINITVGAPGSADCPAQGAGGGATALPASTKRPKVTGTPSYGATVTAVNGTWANAASAKYTYQWLRGGKAIKGATKRTYTVKASDIGKKLSVRVTASTAAGKAAASSASVKGRRAASKVTLKLARKAGAVTATVKVAAGKRTPAAGRVRTYVGGRLVSARKLTAKAKGTVKVTVWAAAGTKVKASYGGTDTWASATRSAKAPK